ncbi:hypothetical protein RhiirA1_450852 [Rhizophagus irregularis]|uniref:Uncharacterized protein n=1 Tax=Rhizophagus irregularis TaxID=588596 RepID=A0A2N0SDT1_9GLOM|nr:hypothetical protein RhiirA1_450852 [Rhizophagus irregularis]
MCFSRYCLTCSGDRKNSNDVINNVQSEVQKTRRGHLLNWLFDRIETPKGKFQIKNSDKVFYQDEEVGEAVITDEKKILRCKIILTDEFLNCTNETDLLRACNGGSQPSSGAIDNVRFHIRINEWSFSDLKDLSHDSKIANESLNASAIRFIFL